MAKPELKVTKKFLEEEYLNKRNSTVEIAKKLGCNTKTIYRKLIKFNIPIRSAKERSIEYFFSKDQLENLYIKENLTINDIGKIFNCAPTTVWRFLKEFNINIGKDKSGQNNPMFGMTGSLSPGWKSPGERRTPKIKMIRDSRQMRKWRLLCFQRDNFTCQKCGDNKGGNLNADHIKPFSFILKENNIENIEDAMNCPELWDINNGRTLCEKCHKKTETWGYKALFFQSKNNPKDAKNDL